jgi:hypothetical protein
MSVMKLQLFRQFVAAENLKWACKPISERMFDLLSACCCHVWMVVLAMLTTPPAVLEPIDSLKHAAQTLEGRSKVAALNAHWHAPTGAISPTVHFTMRCKHKRCLNLWHTSADLKKRLIP